MDQVSHPTAPSSSPGPAGPGEANAPDLTGKTLGDFHLLRRLGEGGMGQVYLAEQVSLKRKVALKLLRADLALNAIALKRFKAEGEAVARATHANIVQVYAIGETNGLHYMALEYVEGRNLREHLEKKGPPELLVTLSIMRQVASALQRASELGIVHRDIKPENILLTRKGEVKVADFGLSRVYTDDRQPLNLTQSGITMGTPLYMSPEQVEGKTVDPRSDIYSFGVTCFHMFAGHPPFRGQTPFEVALQHVQKEPPLLSEIRPDLPADVCVLVHKMMAKRPEDRCQTGREIVKEVGRLRDLIVGVGNLSAPSFVSMGPVPASSSDALPTQAVLRPRRRRWLAWAVGASLVLALAAGLALGFLYYHELVPPESALPAEDTASVKAALGDRKEREEFLLKGFQQYANPEPGRDDRIGLEFATELGLLYLKDRQRLEEADRFFKDLTRPEKKQGYRYLGHLGEAIVLAFQDRPKESNEAFLKLMWRRGDKGQPVPVRGFWVNHPQLREMIARALNQNQATAPDVFPGQLDHLRFPPAPPPRNVPVPKAP